MSTERRCVPGYPRWEADSDGNVYRDGRLVLGWEQEGYIRVSLGQGTVKRSVLICTAFHGERPIGLSCLHEDDVKLNDKPNNLYWGTQSQNMQDAYDNGSVDRIGINNGNCALSEEDVLSIRREYADGATQVNISRKYGIGQAQVSRIVNRQSWRHV